MAMSIFDQKWIPWTGPGHWLFWLALAVAIAVLEHNMSRWWKARSKAG